MQDVTNLKIKWGIKYSTEGYKACCTLWHFRTKNHFCNFIQVSFSGLHPVKFDRGDVLGVILAQQRGGPRQGGAGSDHCAHHDHAYGQRQRCPAQDLLHEVY